MVYGNETVIFLFAFSVDKHRLYSEFLSALEIIFVIVDKNGLHGGKADAF
jgi:hypothetical protein